jgi:hypothetical protein
MLQVHHIVPLSTPPILPERKVCGSLTAFVDVDPVLLYCFRNGEDHLLSENTIFSNTGNLPPGTSSTRRGRPGERGARAREFRDSQGASKPALGALCVARACVRVLTRVRARARTHAPFDLPLLPNAKNWFWQSTRWRIGCDCAPPRRWQREWQRRPAGGLVVARWVVAGHPDGPGAKPRREPAGGGVRGLACSRGGGGHVSETDGLSGSTFALTCSG